MRSSENNEVTPTASAAQPSSGARLRAAREAAGMSVEAVASGLRIAPTQIRALEADDHTAFPAPVFFSGYVRSYARFLNLD
ncbi:MAG: helix-turn-helix domain-containing protein, partial [Chromatiales bacterium]|nr:helix-turn-helix domain-containing protein [Chromatiales bacterium]